MKRRSQTQYIILLDILFLLVLTLSQSIGVPYPSIDYESLPTPGTSPGFSLIAQVPGGLMLLRDYDWVELTDNDPLIERFMTFPCDRKCSQYRKAEHLTLEYVLLGSHAEDVALGYMAKCRLSEATCRGGVFVVGEDAVKFRAIQ